VTAASVCNTITTKYLEEQIWNEPTKEVNNSHHRGSAAAKRRDERVIRQGIERALRDGTEIDDRTPATSPANSRSQASRSTAWLHLAIAEEVHAELTRDFDHQPEHSGTGSTGSDLLPEREWKGPSRAGLSRPSTGPSRPHQRINAAGSGRSARLPSSSGTAAVEVPPTLE